MIIFRLLTGIWCDARTDVVGDLETYDPVWRQILPKLLHANPRGRECPSWRELKAADAERRRFELENALDRSRGKTRREKRRARVAFFVLLACVCAAVFGGISFWRSVSDAPPPTFEEIVFVPKDAPEEEAEGHASREQLTAALPDAWVLAHDLFVDLKARSITRKKVETELKRLAMRAAQDDMDLFDGKSSYTASGENAALAELLREAARRLAERAVRK